DAHGFAKGIDVRRTGQGCCRAAGLSESVIVSAAQSNRRRSHRRVTGVLKVGMVEDIERFHAQEQAEAFRHLNALCDASIKVPEGRSLLEIAAAARLSDRGNAEERLRADDIPAVVMRVCRIGNQRSGVVHRGSLNAGYKLNMSQVVRTYDQDGTGV